MAKNSSIITNKKRGNLIKIYAKKREYLKKKALDVSLDYSERFKYQCLLDSLPKNSSRVRYRNRCSITGRCRGYHRKFGLSRIKVREMASQGLIPGVTKSSW